MTAAAPARALALLLATASLIGCATLTKTTAQTIRLNTDPPGAACQLSRDGAVINEVNPTPATLSVFRSNASITLVCRKAGYLEHRSEIPSGFDGATLGNVVLGGVVGFLVDAGSGSNHEYLPVISILLYPESFDSEAAKESYFDALHQRNELELTREARRIREECSTPHCEQEARAVESSLQARLAAIHKAREEAVVRPPPMEFPDHPTE